MKTARGIIIGLALLAMTAGAAQVGGKVLELIAQHGYFDTLTVDGNSVADHGTFSCAWSGFQVPTSTVFAWQRNGISVQIQPQEPVTGEVVMGGALIEGVDCLPAELAVPGATGGLVIHDIAGCGFGCFNDAKLNIEGRDLILYDANYNPWLEFTPLKLFAYYDGMDTTLYFPILTWLTEE